MHMSKKYSLLPHKGNFTGKTKNNNSTKIKPDPGGQIWNMRQIMNFDHIRVIFLEKLKTTKADRYA